MPQQQQQVNNQVEFNNDGDDDDDDNDDINDINDYDDINDDDINDIIITFEFEIIETKKNVNIYINFENLFIKKTDIHFKSFFLKKNLFYDFYNIIINNQHYYCFNYLDLNNIKLYLFINGINYTILNIIC